MCASVIDASVFVDSLVNIASRGDAARHELRLFEELHVPAIFPAEAASALRRLSQRGLIGESAARRALSEVLRVRLITYPFEPFAERIWELRHNLTVYDAWYVSLAEHLQATLVTADERLLGIPGLACAVRLPEVRGSTQARL